MTSVSCLRLRSCLLLAIFLLANTLSNPALPRDTIDRTACPDTEIECAEEHQLSNLRTHYTNGQRV